MKRREFLSYSLNIAGISVPLIASAQSRPCPPSQVGVSGGSTASTNCANPANAEADWMARASGQGVVWAHDFRRQEELLNFLKVGGDYTLSYPSILLPHRVPDGITGGYCLEYRNIGTTIASGISSGATEIMLTDATDFPDPENGKYKYRLVLQHDRLVDKASTRRENVRVISKKGNVLRVERATDRSKSAVAWPAGTTIGWDCEGQWARPMSAFPAGVNGHTKNDSAAGGTVPLRSFQVTPGKEAGPSLSRFTEGYWGHVDYQKKYPSWQGRDAAWNGNDFFIQFRVKIQGARWHPNNVGDGKLFFLVSTGGGQNQLVGKMHRKDAANSSTTHFEIFTNYGSGPRSQNALTDPQGGRRDALIQPGSAFEKCTIGSKPLDCWEWPADTWVTVLLHVKPGHHNDFQYGIPKPASDGSVPAPRGSIKVDTTAFAPRNNGVTIEFETNVVPKPEQYVFPGSLDNQAVNYFQGWAGEFKSGALLEVGDDSYRVSDYRVINGRARWRLVAFKEGGSLPSGVPTHGDFFGVWWSSVEDAKYKDTSVEVWMAPEGQLEYTPVYKKTDIAYVYGDFQAGTMKRHPFAFNLFQPTSYQNVQDGMRPPQKSYSYFFDQVILSRQFIPCPQA
jgi:hypothetical protein